jgi:hypothetical protein
MAHVLLVVGGLVNAFAATRNIIVALLLVVIAVASPDIFWLLHPPPDPEWIFERCGFGNIPEPGPSDDRLILSFKTDYSTHFGARLNSHYWANREKRLYRDPENPHTGRVTLELFKLNHPQVDSPYDGEIQLIRYRKFLFRPLRPVIIDQFSLWYCLNEGWKARKPYSKGFETLPPSH